MSKIINPNDQVGKKFGPLKIISVVKDCGNATDSIVHVKCDCGRESNKRLGYIMYTKPKSCSRDCEIYRLDSKNKVSEKYDKYINKKFNHLTIESYFRSRSYYKGNNEITVVARCKCDCGRYKETDIINVINNRVLSCGKCRLSKLFHNATANRDIIGDRLLHSYYNLYKAQSTIPKDQLAYEWFNDDNPAKAIQDFIAYCRPLYEKCMSDDDTRHIYIHRIDIDKLLGPGNVYFDHHRYNIHYSGRVYY